MDKPQHKVKVIQVKAKHLPIECPVCHGFGTLKYGSKVCQACEGKGYVLVPAVYEEEWEDGDKDGCN